MTHMTIRDASLFVEVTGQGYPLVLMHGGPGLDHTTFLPLEPLADRFTLIFYDHRCNGRSEGADVSTMTWENLTADADALRQELGFDQWAVLGHSFGGNVALEYALRYPHRVSHLILMDTCGDARWSRDNAPELLGKRGYGADIVADARRFFTGRITPDEFLPISMKLAKAYDYHPSVLYHPTILGLAVRAGLGPPMTFRPEALIFGGQRLLAGWTVMDRLGEIAAPTLVLAGRHDFLFPPEHQAILADRLPNARLELIEQAGHNPQIEQPEETIAAIRQFMASVNVPEAGPACVPSVASV